jgi:putative copper export protein
MVFSLFLAFSLFFCAFYYKNTMDERKHKILMVLVFTMAIHQVIAQVMSLQQVPITQHCSMMSVLLFFSEFVDMPPRV